MSNSSHPSAPRHRFFECGYSFPFCSHKIVCFPSVSFYCYGSTRTQRNVYGKRKRLTSWAISEYLPIYNLNGQGVSQPIKSTKRARVFSPRLSVFAPAVLVCCGMCGCYAWMNAASVGSHQSQIAAQYKRSCALLHSHCCAALASVWVAFFPSHQTISNVSFDFDEFPCAVAQLHFSAGHHDQ